MVERLQELVPNGKTEDDDEGRLYRDESLEDAEYASESAGRRAEEVTATELQNAIIHALSKCQTGLILYIL